MILTNKNLKLFKMKKKQQLKLFVWTNFAPDYTGGFAFAIAENKSEASKLIEEKHGYPPYLWGELKVYSLNKKIAFSVSGGA